ncbi:MAG: hypothetical protein IPN88_03065 [Bacteroidetes bacterium]|nr:hypothetical protein [Bacteroidota bacterium]
MILTITIRDLIVAMGGTAVVIISAFAFGGKILLGKITAKFQHEYNEKIVGLTNELSKSNNLLNNAHSIFLNNVKAINERKILILEQIWKNTFIVKRAIPPNVQLTLWILQDSEWSIETLKNMQPFGKPTKYDSIKMEAKNNLLKVSDEAFQFIDGARCFISQELYQMYWAYNLVIHRTVDGFIRGVTYNNLELWKKDEYTIQGLKTVLRDTELQQIDKKTMGSFSFTVDLLQLKILDRIKQELIGKNESANNLKNLLEVEELKNKIEAGNESATI